MTTAFTPNAANHKGIGPLASRLVHANDMPWEPIRYPGCAVKTLVLDKTTGLLTVLLKMEPGAELPDHEHVMLEQTYVLEGRLVDKDGPDAGMSCGPGEFVWRPPGSRHLRRERRKPARRREGRRHARGCTPQPAIAARQDARLCPRRDRV